jgi:hypothetical protein
MAVFIVKKWRKAMRLWKHGERSLFKMENHLFKSILAMIIKEKNTDGLLPILHEEINEIKLNRQDLFKKFAFYNPDDGSLIRTKSSRHKLIGKPINITAQKKGQKTVLQVSFKSVCYTIQNVIWCYMTGHYPTSKEIVIFVNGDENDRRWKNLRLMTLSEYNHLNNNFIDKSSIGAWHCKKTGGIVSKIRNGKSQILLGKFDDLRSARIFYMKEKLKIRETIIEKYALPKNFTSTYFNKVSE